jgi:hypothetical protein
LMNTCCSAPYVLSYSIILILSIDDCNVVHME